MTLQKTDIWAVGQLLSTLGGGQDDLTADARLECHHNHLCCGVDQTAETRACADEASLFDRELGSEASCLRLPSIFIFNAKMLFYGP